MGPEVRLGETPWPVLFKRSPEALEASRAAWYTIPSAKQSSFYESAIPRGVRRGHVSIAFEMCQLGIFGGKFAHMELEELSAVAIERVTLRSPASQRSRRMAEKQSVEGNLAAHPALQKAFVKNGAEGIYTLANLTDREKRVADLVFRHPDETADDRAVRDRAIRDLMDFKGADIAAMMRRKVVGKIRKLLKEKVIVDD